MDDLSRLVADTVRDTMTRGDGSAVIGSVAEPGLYVQWLLFPEGAGIHLEVSNPSTQRSRGSIWQRLKGRSEKGVAELGEQQVAALARLGFTAGDPNYERDLTAEQLERGEAAEILTRALREVLGIRDVSEVTVEVP